MLAAGELDETSLVVGAGFSALELTGAWFWADWEQMDPGMAHTIENGGDAIAGLALSLGYIGGLFDGGGAESARWLGGLGLLGSATGILGGRLLAEVRDYSWGDAEVMRMAGLLGILGGVAVTDWL